MHVLFNTHWWPTEREPSKGVFIREQAMAIAAQGVGVTVLHICIQGGPGLMRFSTSVFGDGPLKVHRISIIGRWWKLVYVTFPLQWWLLKQGLRRLGIDAKDFDLIHSNVIHPSGVMGHRMAISARRPHVMSEHWSNVAAFLGHRWTGKEGKDAMAGLSRVFPVSEYLGGIVRQFVPDPSKVVVVPEVIQDNGFGFRPAPIGSTLYFVMCAKWDRGKRLIKRPDLVIEAVAKAQKEISKDVILGIIGSGDWVPELKELARQRGVNAHFYGHMKKADVAHEFQRADLFLHASMTETFSIVVGEALRCGTPVVASKVGGIPELVAPETGLLVENTVDHWHRAIVQAATTRFDRPAIANAWNDRATPGAVGRALVAEYRAVLGSI
jgi:glycosyltransferase involved in cell wall biosynthesis